MGRQELYLQVTEVNNWKLVISKDTKGETNTHKNPQNQNTQTKIEN